MLRDYTDYISFIMKNSVLVLLGAMALPVSLRAENPALCSAVPSAGEAVCAVETIDVQSAPFIEIPSSAYGEWDGAPLVLSCQALPYALIFNPSMNHGYVLDLVEKRLHRMDDRGAIDVVYGGSLHGDDMARPYDVGSIDGIRMFRNYFSLRDGNRVVYLNKQGECLRQCVLMDDGSERIEYSFADIKPTECIASFEQFSPAELYGDTSENCCLTIRDENGAKMACLLDSRQKELWHRELPASFADISWEEQRVGFGLFYVIGSKIYVPFRDWVTCISQESVEDVLYERVDSQDCITKNYACKMGPDAGVFIRLVLGEKSSFWEIVQIHGDEVCRRKLALNDAKGNLYQWVKNGALSGFCSVVPDELTPQMVGDGLILLTGKGDKWEYTRCDMRAQALARLLSDEPVFFHYCAYLKAFIATTKGISDTSDGAGFKATTPARMYFLKCGD